MPIHPFFLLPKTATTEEILATLGLCHAAKGSPVNISGNAKTASVASLANVASNALSATSAVTAQTATTAAKATAATYAETALRSVQSVPENYNSTVLVNLFKT